MNASKENAERALGMLGDLNKSGLTSKLKAAEDFVREFIEAAKRKLPSEAAYAREKAKR